MRTNFTVFSKRICFLFLFSLVATIRLSAQTAPAKQWDKTFGGSNREVLYSMQQTSDGGYILGGESLSGISGDKSQASQGGYDFWVVKLDANGNKIWDKTFGGSNWEYFVSLQQTSDGGYILGGSSESGISGDKTQASNGGPDYWVIKLDASGNKTWDKSFGGSGIEYLQTLQQTSDGGYILGGSSFSDISGDKTQASKGTEDYWVVKLDGNGNKSWDKTIGGSDNDKLWSLQQTSDGGYILGGNSLTGISGDKSQISRGGWDYWVVKLDASGNKTWDKAFGGSSSEYPSSLMQTAEGGYIIGGYSDSGIGGDKTQASKGYNDYWVVKMDASGNKTWDKTIGGLYDDYLYSLLQAADGGYMLGGRSYAGTGGDKTHAGIGYHDYWVVKLDASGNKTWDKAFGGVYDDYLYSIKKTSDGGFVLGGYSESGIGGDKSQTFQGGGDYWVVKLAAEASTPTITGFTPANGPVGTSVIISGTNFTGAGVVKFNNVTAGFTVNSATQITATVPTGATTGVITVNTAGGTATSSSNFTVTTPLSITTDPLVPSNGCEGYPVNVSFTTSGTFNAGNTFTAVLINSSGSATPINIGSVTGTASGTIFAIIPTGTLGLGYDNIRVVASSPVTTGSNTAFYVQPTVNYYEDTDRDGYFSTTPTNRCYQPTGISYQLSPGNDCNDFDNAIHPGATEVCDGKDNNCDGIQDDITAVNAVYITPTGSNPPTGNIGQAVCQGSSLSLYATVQDAQASTGQYNYSYQWYKDGNLISGQTGMNYNAATAGTYYVQVRKYCVSYPAAGITSNSNTITVTVNTAPTVTATGGGVCEGNSVNLFASYIAGATYSWTGPNNFTSTLQNPTVTNVNAAKAGTYIVTAIVNGCSSSATTSISLNDPIYNNWISSDQTICAGQPAAVLTGTTPTGGDGFGFSYFWQSSTSSATTGFTTIPTAMSSTYAPGAVSQTTWFRRAVISGGGCENFSAAVRIEVVAPISNNSIGSDQTINSGQAAALLAGTAPNGGSWIYSYQWESSTVSATSGFAAISGAASMNYSPGTLTQSTWYRRIITSGSCTSVSNVVAIQVMGANIVTGNIPANYHYCPGATLSVPFTVSGTLNSGNVFTAQLSSSNGSFANPVNLGTITGIASDSISVTIPMGTAGGLNYRIRVVASDPALTGTDNGQDISIFHPVDYYLDSDNDGNFSATPTNLCYAPLTSYQTIAGNDCDDFDNAVYPGAPELCDGKDNNCDGMQDNIVTVAAQASASVVALSNTVTLSVVNPDTSHTYAWSGNGLNATSGSLVTALPTAVGTNAYIVTASNGLCSATDTVSVTVQNPVKDAGITSLLKPEAAGCYGSGQVVEVRLKNFGNTTLTSVPVQVKVSGALTVTLTATYTGSLAPGDSADLIVGSFGMTRTGSYTFRSETKLTGDAVAANNVLISTRSVTRVFDLPLDPVTFDGFTSTLSLSGISLGWNEGTGAGTPVTGNSDWKPAAAGQITNFGSETGIFSFDGIGRNHWLISPKFVPTDNTRLYFDAAVTQAGSLGKAVMGSGDSLKVMVSTNCGKSYSPLYTIEQIDNLTDTLTSFTVKLDQFQGQEIMLGFLAKEGTSRPAPVDLHLDNIQVGDPGIYSAVFDQCLTTQPVLANGNGEWKELVQDGNVVGAINDNGVNLGTVTVDFHLNDVLLNGIRLDQKSKPMLSRYFKINATNHVFTGQQIGLRLYVLDTEIDELVNLAGSGVSSVNDLQIVQYSGQNENCFNTDNDSTTSTTITSYLRNQITKTPYQDGYMLELTVNDHFSEFYMKADPNPAAPLPVELLSFKAFKKAKDALLEWETAIETNNAGYEIQVSTDGRKFYKLDWVEGKGSNSRYEFLDTEAGKAGTRYYRLKQMDQDGKYTFSPIRNLSFEGKEHTVEAWPNPFSNNLNLNFTVSTEGPVTIRLVDFLGRVRYQQENLLKKGEQQVELELTDKLPQGIYLVEIIRKQEREILKVIKK